MTRHRSAVISLLIVLAFGASIVSVQALPTCEKLVKSFVEKRVKNKVSPEVARRWAEWGKGHPNFKPGYRPKYKVTRKEVISKVAFACPAPTPDPESAPELPIEISVVPASPVGIPYIQPTLPPIEEVATNQPPLTFVPPYTTGVTPPPISSVPEPDGLVLGITGVSMVAMFVLFSRKRREEPLAA